MTITAEPATDHAAVEEQRRAALLAAAVAEITARGGETTIIGKYGITKLRIADENRDQGMVLVTAEGWRQYSNAFGARWSSLAYLYGIDDNGPWAVRVPITVGTVRSALLWITPTEVKDALATGRRVKRQGDVYAVELTPRRQRLDGTWSPLADDDTRAAHRWNPTTRYLTHTPTTGRRHRPVKVSYPAIFIPQRVYGMGRGAGRANGD